MNIIKEARDFHDVGYSLEKVGSLWEIDKAGWRTMSVDFPVSISRSHLQECKESLLSLPGVRKLYWDLREPKVSRVSWLSTGEETHSLEEQRKTTEDISQGLGKVLMLMGSGNHWNKWKTATQEQTRRRTQHLASPQKQKASCIRGMTWNLFF